MDPEKLKRELSTLTAFIGVFCHRVHGTRKGQLCPDCIELLEYSTSRLKDCPYTPKPDCKSCKTHCYNPFHRQRIRQVMKFSGIYFIKRGRIDWLARYFLN
ncbi:MAG: nitrous oxide-stimulated promoter family protein [Myxococcota bacterium]|jgi:hypothetical protein